MTSRHGRRAVPVLSAAAVLVGIAAASSGAATSAPSPAPASSSTSTTGTSANLSAPAGRSVVVSVATRSYLKLAPTVTADGATFRKVGEVDSAQGVERLSVFISDAPVSGTVSVSLPGNNAAAAVTAVGVQGRVERTVTTAGPAVDSADVSVPGVGDVPAGGQVVSVVAHRLREVESPVVTASAGSSGSRIAGSVVMGSTARLSGADDWAAASVVLAPATSPYKRPYRDDSFWNTPIAAGTQPIARSTEYVTRMRTIGASTLTSDPKQFTFPVWKVTPDTPMVTVEVEKYFSTYTSDTTRKGHGWNPTVQVPLPAGAVPSFGYDGNIIIVNEATGDEYGLFRFRDKGDGTYLAEYGYRTNTAWSGRFADGLAGRGAGVTYLGGLVRPAEIEAGRIDHALAMTYKQPESGRFVYPASKTDGRGVAGLDLPEGAHLRLDPTVTEADFDRWGLSPEARTIARALQTYGVYIVDTGGSTKILVEAEESAHWNGKVSRETVSGIPLDRFQVISA